MTSSTITKTSTAITNPPLPGIPLGVRIANLSVIFLPFAGLIVAFVALWGWGFGWVELGLLLSMYVLTVLGITVGFHRLFTHRAFETHGFVQVIFGILGSMAAEGPLLEWVAQHRHHHRFSDQRVDRHSPHFFGQGFWGMLRGLWNAHLGWIFIPEPQDLHRYAADLRRSPTKRLVNALFPLWVALGLLLPGVLGGLLSGTWTGAILGFLWGGLVRMFLVHHVTWSINSVCHLWGGQPYRTKDQSKNNVVFGILALGEGWHNNHHAFPTSARHGLRWWQIDVSYWVIRGLALIGLAWKVRVPSKQQLATNHV
jgi:stearoyl-CoA desaturase (delta-9 desaturase)